MAATAVGPTSSSFGQASTSNVSDGDSSLHPFVTQKLVDTGKYFCPFLERGFCRESTRCNFSHDSHSSTKIPTDFCHFYLANKCLYGQDCKFIHGEPNPMDDTILDIANIDLTESRHDDNQDHHFYLDFGESEHSYPEVVNYANEHESQVPTNTEPLYCLSGRVEYQMDNSDETSSTASQSHKPVSSSSTSSHQNRSKNSDSRQTPSSSQAHTTNLVSLRAIVASTPISSKTNITPKCSPKTDCADKVLATKAWQGGRLLASLKGESSGNQGAQLKDLPLCPYAVASGDCPYPDGACTYLHGQVCDLCCMPCLHPYDESQRRRHRDDCLREHEREMEFSFAVQRSKDKICGICMETVVEKKPVTSSRFGILEKCNHIFCLDCIRKWRGTKQFDSKTIRACPECRVNSDFVVPSKYWIEDQDDKEKLIRDYKAALRSKPCRYFNEGMGDCPFAGSCFYKHAYPDGRLAEMEAPKPRRRVYGARGTASLTNYALWSLIRSFDDDDWSNDDESESRLFMGEDDDYYDNVDDDDEDDDETNIAEYTTPVW